MISSIFKTKKEDIDKIVVMSYEDSYMSKELDILKTKYGQTKTVELDYLLKENPNRRRRKSIFTSSELLRVIITKFPKKSEILHLANLYDNDRLIVLECNNECYNYLFENYSNIFYFFNYLRSYEEKSKWCTEYLKYLELRLDSKSTQSSLIFFMITNTDKWIEIEMLKDVIIDDYDDKKLTLEELTEYLPDYEFYRLSDWVESVIKGTTKTTPIKRLDYFINSRGHSYRTMILKLKEYIEFLLILKQLHIDGYIYSYLGDKELTYRLNKMKKESLIFDYNESIKKGIDIVKTLSKNELLRMYKLTIESDEYTRNRMIYILESIRTGKDEKDKVKFKYKRKFKH